MTSLDAEGANHVDRFLRWTKTILTIIGIVGGWALGLTYFLVSLRDDLRHLQAEHYEIVASVKKIDDAGTRALETVRSRQNDAIAVNISQDQRMRDLEKQIEVLRQTNTENRFLIEQLKAAISVLSHPVLTSPGPPLIPPPTPSKKP